MKAKFYKISLRAFALLAFTQRKESMKNLLTKAVIIPMIFVAGFFTSCNDKDGPISTLATPTNLQYNILNQENVELTWDAVENAESYTIEVFANGSMNFEGAPMRAIPGITQSPYTVSDLSANTNYSVRIRAVSSAFKESEWTGITFKTGEEQLFETVGSDDVTMTQVTLRWEAGQAATKIVLTPGDINYTVTVDDIAAGEATITGLTGGTEYTAKLMNNNVVRGTITFTTLSEDLLEAAQDFTLIYTGSSQTDGQNINTTIGIKWVTNTGSNTSTFRVEPEDGGKFVMLMKTQFDAITTKDALKNTYAAGAVAGVSEYSARQNSNFEPIYFITKVGEDYFKVEQKNLSTENSGTTGSTSDFSYQK